MDKSVNKRSDLLVTEVTPKALRLPEANTLDMGLILTKHPRKLFLQIIFGIFQEINSYFFIF